jgi:hypothetical protein
VPFPTRVPPMAVVVVVLLDSSYVVCPGGVGANRPRVALLLLDETTRTMIRVESLWNDGGSYVDAYFSRVPLPCYSSWHCGVVVLLLLKLF